jgi:hypothetical protein
VLKGLSATIESESIILSESDRITSSDSDSHSCISLKFVQGGISITLEVPAAKQQRVYLLNKKLILFEKDNRILKQN